MMTVIVDAAQLEAAFRKAPAKVLTNLDSWVKRTGLRAEREAKQDVYPRIDTGQTQSSIHTTFGTLTATVKPTAKQAIFAHEGRRPGKMPPFQEGTPLNTWAKKHGIPPFVLARSIGRKGIKPHRFMKDAFDTVKPAAEADASRMLADIVRSI